MKEEAEEVCQNEETGAHVKEEVECEDSPDLCELYAGHQVKDELVLGPVELHRPRVPSAPPATPNRAKEVRGRAGSVKLENQVATAQRVGVHPYTLRHTLKLPSKYTDTSSNSKASYRCNKCGIGFKNKAVLRKHEYTHLSESVSQYTNHFACKHCNSKFKTELLLIEHGKQDHGVKAIGFMCFECDYRTNDKRRFESHLNRHTEREQYNCCHCSYASPYKRALDIHLMLHGREILYKCNQCDYKTKHKSELLSHRNTHGNKPFKCCYCDYKCRRRTQLQRHQERHIMIHTTGKQLKTSAEYKCGGNLKSKKSGTIHQTLLGV